MTNRLLWLAKQADLDVYCIQDLTSLIEQQSLLFYSAEEGVTGTIYRQFPHIIIIFFFFFGNLSCDPTLEPTHQDDSNEVIA